MVQSSFEIDKCVLAPYLFLDIFPRHNFSGPRGEKHQKLERLRLHAKRGAESSQLFVCEVELIHTERDRHRIRHRAALGI
jgi:hypothetical protein